MRSRASNRIIVILVIAGACALLAWQLVSNGKNGAWLMGDFRAFYCGGTMLLHGQSPYAAAALLHCERSPQPFGLHTARPGVALPVPFPGYVLAVFVPFALLPYPLAAAVWFVLLLCATAASCHFLARLCSRPVIVPLVVLAFALGVAVIPYGELSPFVIASLTGGALALRQRFSWKVVVAVAVTAVVPQVALPVYTALFIVIKTARLPIVLLGSVLLTLDIAVTGPALALFYFVRVLPNHAASEVGYIMQYSAAWFAQGLGASDRAALLLGDLSYIVMIAAGIWAAGRLKQKFDDAAFLFLIPSAFAVIGGPFVHYSEITIALPAALLLYSRSSDKVRVCAAVSLVLLAMPWEWILTQPTLAVPIVVWTVAVAAVALSTPLSVALRTGLLAALFCAACMSLAVIYGPQVAAHSGSVLDPSLAEASWARFVSEKTSSAGLVWWLGKAPTWIGLAVLAIAVGASAVTNAIVCPLRCQDGYGESNASNS